MRSMHLFITLLYFASCGVFRGVSGVTSMDHSSFRVELRMPFKFQFDN